MIGHEYSESIYLNGLWSDKEIFGNDNYDNLSSYNKNHIFCECKTLVSVLFAQLNKQLIILVISW